MKKILLIPFFIASVSSASVEMWNVGSSNFWDGNMGISTSVYFDGSTSISSITPERAEQMGYSRSEKSTLKEVWKYDYKGRSGKLTINRRGEKALDNIVVENKTESGISWQDITVFGDDNKVVRRTTCRERRCFVVSESICKEFAKGGGLKEIERLSSDVKSCQELGTRFKQAMDGAIKSGTLNEDFKNDDRKLPSTLPMRGRGVVMGSDIDAGIANLVRYVDMCKSFTYFNKPLGTFQRMNDVSPSAGDRATK